MARTALKQRIQKWLWPSRLAGQMIAVVLLGLGLALAISFWMLGDAHRDAVFQMNRGMLVRQMSSLTLLIEDTPKNLHPAILRTARREFSRFEVADYSLIPPGELSKQEQLVSSRIRTQLDNNDNQRQIRVELSSIEPEEKINVRRGRLEKYREKRHKEHEWYRAPPKLLYLNISIELNNGKWLNMQSFAPKTQPWLAVRTLFFLLLSAVCVIAGVIFMVRRIVKPINQLADASHKLGLGEKTNPVAEKGPEDIREMIRAFNEMNERIQRFVADRTRMMAALSHDLRTPITSMRLRVEMMDDTPDKEHLLNTLDEMQQMSEATLAFIRQASDNEETRAVDLDALLDSLCEDLQDIGMNARYHDGDEVIIRCRLVSLKRALRNLIENAVKYGQQAEVWLEPAGKFTKVCIQDQGEGIPEEMVERIFEPFVRLETSRNRETGGIGLGMSIARNIIRSHGGEIQLENNEQGLKISVLLPES